MKRQLEHSLTYHFDGFVVKRQLLSLDRACIDVDRLIHAIVRAVTP